MRTEAEISQARALLHRAYLGAERKACPAETLRLKMFIDLLNWVQGGPSAFGPQLLKWTAIARALDAEKAAGN